ncbi:transposase family protein [Streptomyces sp. ISL-86]|uniref:transposase family protein n=1 Tax=Streptomyces sp. ISL-86 TaxID=2819187 RepID=UPI0035A822A3
MLSRGSTAGNGVLLYGRCAELLGEVVRRGGRPAAIGLYQSVMLVVCLMRKNLTQEVAGAVFGVSQSTVSRRWDLLRPIIRRAGASFIPRPRDIAGAGTLLTSMFRDGSSVVRRPVSACRVARGHGGGPAVASGGRRFHGSAG